MTAQKAFTVPIHCQKIVSIDKNIKNIHEKHFSIGWNFGF